mgnify:CR=1 FL=1
MSKIAEGDTENERSVYSSFLSKQDSVMSWLSSELLDGNTPYGSLSEENQVYVWYVYEMLMNEGVLNKDSIDTSNDVYTAWTDSNSVSIFNRGNSLCNNCLLYTSPSPRDCS